MTPTLDKQTVLDALRKRGLDARADFVGRELPDAIDVQAHAGLLAMLGLTVEGDHLVEDSQLP